MLNDKGPHLSTAVLCETVLQESNGVLSLIRIVDRVTQTVVDPNAPEEMPPVVLNFKAVISFKSGEARGSYSVKLRPQDPSGQQLPSLDTPIHFEGEGDRGQNLIIDFRFRAEMAGLYWVDVLFEDDLITRMPMRVIYQPQRVS